MGLMTMMMALLAKACRKWSIKGGDTLNYSIEYDLIENIIIGSLWNEITSETLDKFIAEIIQLSKKENCFHILVDVSKANLELSLQQVYLYPDNLSELVAAQNLKIQDFKRAFVASKDQGILEFYETMARNRNHTTKLFHDFEEAKKWLHLD